MKTWSTAWQPPRSYAPVYSYRFRHAPVARRGLPTAWPWSGSRAARRVEERNTLAEFGQRRAEAELGVEVDFILPAAGEDYEELFAGGEDGYDLVVSLGQDSSLEVLSARPEDTGIAALRPGFRKPAAGAGEEEASLVRYRVEEGSYVCGYLAGWLSGRSDHPLTNPIPLVAFIGAMDDPLMIYYNAVSAGG